MSIEVIEAVIDLIEMGGMATTDDIVKCLRSAIAEAEKREWQGLTDEEMYQLANQVGFDAELMQRNHDKGNPSIAEHFARAIEAKLKEKNCA